MSFAPLAARLAAQAAKIRTVDGARVDVAMIMALFVCALLEMLICVCEALDAEAAVKAARAVAAPRNARPGTVPALCAGRQASLSEGHAPRLALVPEVCAITPSRAVALSGTTKHPTPATLWLAWSRDPGPSRAVLAPPWRPRRETRAFAPHQARVFCCIFLTKSQIDEFRSDESGNSAGKNRHCPGSLNKLGL